MRAILIKDGKGPIENLYIGEAPTPVPNAVEVLVKIKAFGLNGMDIIQREGHYPPPPGSSPILGVEFSGQVSEVGTDVSQWKVGDEVFGLAGGGAYAEFIVVPQENILRKPVHLSWVEAASILENYLTAFQAIVMYGELKKDDHVLVHAGASGVGIAAIQLSRDLGAKTVTATASGEEKLSWLRSIPNGATHTVNYKTQDFAAETKRTTGGNGVDVLVDFVGKTHWAKNIESLAVDGRMTMLALLSGDTVEAVNLGPLLHKRLRIQGSTLRSRTLAYQADLITRFAREVLEKISGCGGNGAIRIYIHKVYPWTHIQDAHQEMANSKNIGKIIAEVI
jgi:putative PIG3 family NAD(P)H quinone oxidoreductase